ncbi:MAG: sugar phosphate isomerase/epimerase [Pseudomonadota bacterium]|nr:sugar phosphate isomerase/epimerase [Pseudomonadota bacterium]
MAFGRRHFLKSSAALATLAGSPLLWSCSDQKTATACNNAAGYGVQLYMFRESFAKDPKGTLAQIAAMGFTQVEPFGLGGFIGISGAPFFGLSIDEIASALKAVNLKTPTAHVNGQLDDPIHTNELASKLGIDYFIEPLAQELLAFNNGKVSIAVPDTAEKVLQMADRINLRGKKFHEQGFGFAYHNHHMEFTQVEGKTILDWLMENTDPNYVKLQLDLGWVAVADIAPLEALKKYGNRVIGCHMKDRDYSISVNPDETDELMPEALQVKAPGQGGIDFTPILAHLDELNIQNRYVEVDVTAKPYEDAKFGLAHLQNVCR